MLLKLDENLGPSILSLFRTAGHEVDTVLEEGLAGAPDGQVFEASKEAGRALVTLDLDFANPLRFPAGATPGVVVLRPARTVLVQIEQLALEAIGFPGTENPSGKIWIVEPGRIRIHTPQ